MTPKRTIFILLIIISFIYVFPGCRDYNYVTPSNGNGGTNVIANDSLFEPFLKAYFASQSAYNHYPRPFGIDTVKKAFALIWRSDSVVFGIKNPGFATAEQLLNYNSVQTVKNYLYTYSLSNNAFLLQFEYIHSFGIKTMQSMPTGVLGFNLGYKYGFMGVGNFDSSMTGYPSICFTNTNDIRERLAVGGFDSVKINRAIVYVTVHELTHGRGLADITGSADSVHFGHQDYQYLADNRCYMNNLAGVSLFSTSYNYPPILCDKHKRWTRDSLKLKIKTGLRIQ